MSTKQIYRQLLRSVDRNISAVSGSKEWRNYIALKFRQSVEGKTEATVANELQLAKDYAFLINNIADHRVC